MPKPKFPHFIILNEVEENKLIKIQKKRPNMRLKEVLMKGVYTIVDEIKNEVTNGTKGQ